MHRVIIFVFFLISLTFAGGQSAFAEPPSVQPEIASTHRLTLVLREGYSSVAGRVTVTNLVTGEPFWPEDPAVPVYTSYTGHDYFYADGSMAVTVTPGWVKVVASRGPEYEVVEQYVYVVRNLTRELSFNRLFDLRSYGYYSGDTHVHIAHGGSGAVYTITNEDLARAARAEDLRVTCALTNGPYFNGGIDPAGDADHLLHFGVEYRSALYGHMGMLGLSALPSQYGCCLPGSPAYPMNAQMQAEAHGLGGTVVYAHPVTMDPDEMNNTSAAWPYSGFCREVPVDLLVGEVDAYDIFSYSNFDQNESRLLWFDLLNLGRRLPLSVGTDASLNRYYDPPAGGYRVYVKSGEGLDFDSWCAGLRAGQSFATNGPFLAEFSLNGVEPGGTLNLSEEGTDPVEGQLLLLSRTPATRLEIYERGQLVHVETLPAYSGSLNHVFQLSRPTQPGWLVARVTGPPGSPVDVGWTLEAMTSPVYVQLDGVDMAPHHFASLRFDTWMEDLQSIILARDDWDNPSQAAAAWNLVEDARQELRERGESDGDPDLDHFKQIEPMSVNVSLDDAGMAFRAAGEGEARLEVFDVQGRLVFASSPQPLPSEFRWRHHVEGRELAAGLYFGRIRTAETTSRTYRIHIVH